MALSRTILRANEQEFWQKVGRILVQPPPHQRRGQALFNALEDHCQVLADAIRGDANLDPYYVDENIPAMFEWLGQLMELNAD